MLATACELAPRFRPHCRGIPSAVASLQKRMEEPAAAKTRRRPSANRQTPITAAIAAQTIAAGRDAELRTKLIGKCFREPRVLSAARVKARPMNLPLPSEGQARLIRLALTGLAMATLAGLGVALIWGIGQVLQMLSSVLWPLAVGGVVACLLDPIVDFLEKQGLSRIWAIVTVFTRAALSTRGAQQANSHQ